MSESGPAAATAPARPSLLLTWIHACRVPTLTAAVVPVLVGSAVAWRHEAFRAGPALAALAGAVFIQIGTNLANDLFDFAKGADSPARIGPPRALAMGWLTPAAVRDGMIVSFAAAVVAGIYLVEVGGWPILAIGVASIAAGIAYTAGPYALAYMGLGDAFVFIFFGIVAVLGTYYVQAGGLDPEAALAALPVGALATAILVVNNVRDADSDRAVGKRTLAVLLGPRAARAEFGALLLCAYMIPVGLWAHGIRSAWVLLPLATATLAARTLHAVVEHAGGPALNRALLDTARLHALFGLLFAAGIVLG